MLEEACPGTAGEGVDGFINMIPEHHCVPGRGLTLSESLKPWVCLRARYDCYAHFMVN